jgi:hypothetical protein
MLSKNFVMTKTSLKFPLACDDEQIQAHEVILAACSPFFRNILRRNPHQHPMLYMKGVKFTDLQAVLNSCITVRLMWPRKSSTPS